MDHRLAARYAVGGKVDEAPDREADDGQVEDYELDDCCQVIFLKSKGAARAAPVLLQDDPSADQMGAHPDMAWPPLSEMPLTLPNWSHV